MQRISTDRVIRDYFPQQSFWQVYHEAVHNAADAGATRVEIHIKSDGQVKAPDFEMEIRDNGRGFMDEDFERFSAIKDPKDADHKGLGRLIYLAYFDKVIVESVFRRDDKTYTRSFVFSRKWSSKSEVSECSENLEPSTRLRFVGYRKSKLAASKYIKPGDICDNIKTHFYPLLQAFRRTQREFEVTVALVAESNKQLDLVSASHRLSPSELPDLKCEVVSEPTLDLHADITIWYEIDEDSGTGGVKTIASVDGRTVELPILRPSAIPPGSSAFFLLESPLFTGMTDTARERLVLSGDITLNQIRDAVGATMHRLLADSIPAIAEKNAATKTRFDERFPHLAGYLDYNSIGLIDSDHTIREGQARFFLDQREVLEADHLDDSNFEKALDVSARSLTEYILYRQQVIQKLSNTPASARESVVHELFAPQREVFSSDNLFEDVYRNNAWLLDDKFMTFRTILSEQDMEEVVKHITLDSEVQDKGRPDITLIFNAEPTGDQKVDVVVVELKRRAVNDKEGTYAATQLLKRARLLVDHCPNIQRVWYYGIVEMNPALKQLLIDDEWVELFSKGTVLHRARRIRRTADQKVIPCPFFLLSFDAVVEDAAARNHTFLEVLRGKIRNQSLTFGTTNHAPAVPDVG